LLCVIIFYLFCYCSCLCSHAVQQGYTCTWLHTQFSYFTDSFNCIVCVSYRYRSGSHLRFSCIKIFLSALNLEKERKRKEEYLYSPCRQYNSTTKRSDVDHTELPANTPHLPFLHIRIR